MTNSNEVTRMTNQDRNQTPAYVITDELYKRWEAFCENKSERMTLQDLLNFATPRERLAVNFVWFDSQVLNGGFMQWHDNGYSEFASQLVDDLERMQPADQSAVAHVLLLIEKHWRAIDDYGPERYDLQDGEDFDDSLLYDALDALDDRYYEIDDEFLHQVSVYLSQA